MGFHTLKTTHRNLMIFTISCLSLLVIKTFQITSVFIYFIWWYFTNLKKGWCYYCTPGYISKPQGWNMNPKCILRRAKLTSNYNEGQVNRHSGALPLFWQDFLFIIIIFLFFCFFFFFEVHVVVWWDHERSIVLLSLSSKNLWLAFTCFATKWYLTSLMSYETWRCKGSWFKLVLYLLLILETFVEILSLFKIMDQVPPIWIS
jgi:hypothetical protein